MTTNHDEETSHRRLRWMLSAAGVLAVALTVIWWPGCRQYPAVSSKESLVLMKLLYAACNTADPERLAKVEEGVETLTREGKMTPAEKLSFDRIVAMARNGEWRQAERAAFKFAQDQVGVGHPANDRDSHEHHHDPSDSKAKRP